MWLKKFVFFIVLAVFGAALWAVSFFVGTDTVLCRICYPNSDCVGILAQSRRIKKSENRRIFVKNIVEETILGPVEGNIGLNKKNLAVNVFPKEAKLNSAFVSEDTVYLDFNKELLLNVTKNVAERAAKNEKKIEENSSEKNICKFSLNYLILYSIIDSVNLNCRELTKFHISFDGVSYKYIDDFGPTDGELYADYKVLVR